MLQFILANIGDLDRLASLDATGKLHIEFHATAGPLVFDGTEGFAAFHSLKYLVRIFELSIKYRLEKYPGPVVS